MQITRSWRPVSLAYGASALLALTVGQAQSLAVAEVPTTPVPAMADTANAQGTPIRRSFTRPEDAVRAMLAAVAAPTLEPLTAILGRRVLESIPPEERQSTELRRATGQRLASQRFEIEYIDPERSLAVAVFGNPGVNLPAILENTRRGWMFAPEATIAAMQERRIGANEANALRALGAFKQAQEIYRLRDMTDDGVLQYARRIRSTPGKNDGLVTSASGNLPGPATSLLNEAFARAEGNPGDAALRPSGGYAYKVLHAQGAAAEGGAGSYSINGRLSEGYAILAWPTRPGENGLSTFIMNHRGAIFEREFGNRTASQVRLITVFDPGPGWTRVEE